MSTHSTAKSGTPRQFNVCTHTLTHTHTGSQYNAEPAGGAGAGCFKQYFTYTIVGSRSPGGRYFFNRNKLE